MIRRSARIFLEVVAILVAGIAALVGLAAWRLSQGPVALDFLTPYFEESLNGALDDATVSIEGTVVSWEGWAETVDLRVTGVQVRGEAGTLISRVPSVGLKLSVTALLSGALAPTTVEIERISLALIRNVDGSIELVGGTPKLDPDGDENDAEEIVDEGSDPEAGNAVSTLLNVLIAPAAPDSPGGYLQRVEIDSAFLRLIDMESGRAVQFSDASFGFERSNGGLLVDGSAVAALGEEKPVVGAQVHYDPETENLTGIVTLQHLRPRDLARTFPDLGELARLDVALDGIIDIEISRRGAIREIAFNLSGRDGSVAAPELSAGKLDVAQVVLQGRYEGDIRRLVLDELTVDTGGPVITASGRATGLGVAATLSADISIRDIAATDIFPHWPADLEPQVRDWIATNILSGQVEELRTSLVLRSDPASPWDFEVASIAGEFNYSDVTATYLDGMPPATGAEGIARFTEESVSFVPSGGTLDGLRVTAATIDFTGLTGADQFAEFDLTVQGPLREALEVLDRPRLGLAGSLGIRPGEASGIAAVRLKLTVPLLSALDFDDIDVAASASLSDASLQNAFRGHAFTDGELTLAVTKREMEVAGRVTMLGQPTNLVWREKFGADASFRRRYDVSLTLDDAARAAAGIDFGTYVAGPVGVELIRIEQEGGASETSVAADLRDARLELEPVAWVKPPGEDAVARFRLLQQDDVLIEIADLALNAEGLAAEGRFLFDEAGGVRQVILSRFDYGGSQLRGEFVRREDGGFDGAVEGEVLDLRPALSDWLAGGPERAAMPSTEPIADGKTSIVLDVDRVLIGTGEGVRNLTGIVEREGERWSLVDIAGRFGEQDAQLDIRMVPYGPGRRLKVSASDAGELLRQLGWYDSMIGGDLALNAEFDDRYTEGLFRGNLQVEEFKIIRTPLLARLFSVASLDALVNLANGEGIPFHELEFPFVHKGDTLFVVDARMAGSSVGLTMDGTLEFASDEIDLDGTLVPAYGVNSLLSNIPLVGPILTGGKGEGIFAATYTIDGTLNEPTVTVNPLAVLAPGFLRKLFGVFAGDGGDAGPVSPETKRSEEIRP